MMGIHDCHKGKKMCDPAINFSLRPKKGSANGSYVAGYVPLICHFLGKMIM
jgi:hypothetical protein